VTSDPRDRRPWRTDDEWTRLHARLFTADADAALPARRHRAPIWAWSAVAAAIVLAAIGLSLVRRSNPASSAQAVPAIQLFATKPGERRVVHLDDSSTITLAPATTLRVAGDRRRREIDLDGMADFQVRHDSAHTFVVKTRDASTTDIGTRFVIRAYAADSSVRVAVTDGSVLVRSRQDSASSVTLTAGEVAVVRGSAARKLTASFAPLYSTWIDGGLSFDNATLGAVAADLERWFDVEIRMPRAVRQRRLSAVYNDPTLNAVLDALSATLGVTYTRDGRIVTIRERVPR
jgi:transmembrane sensor